MIELTVTATRANVSPAVGFDKPDHVANFHRTIIATGNRAAEVASLQNDAPPAQIIEGKNMNEEEGQEPKMEITAGRSR